LLDEIHYLKSFFPDRFSVEEAYYASRIELIKVIIISLPLALIIYVCLRLLDIFRNQNNEGGQETTLRAYLKDSIEVLP